MPIHRIEVPTPWPIGSVNAYLVEGEGGPLTLVDCGPELPGAWEALTAGITATGHAVADVEQLVVTHAHVDHHGLARRVREASGCRVLAPLIERDVVSAFEAFRQSRWRATELALLAAGCPPAEIKEVHKLYSLVSRAATSCPVDAALDEGDVVRMGGADFRVLHVPGHSPGHLAFHEPVGGALLSGDAVLERVSSNAICIRPEESSALMDHVATLTRLRTLDPTIVYPGHRAPFGNLAAVVSRHEEALAARTGRVRELVREKGPLTPREVVSALFIGKVDLFLALSEVQGHLHLLARRGDVSLREEGGLLTFEAAH